MGSLFASAILQWWLRRFWEMGGLISGAAAWALGIYSLMPSDMQQIVLQILQGNWEDLSLKSAIGFIVYLFVQWRSYRATSKPQMVVDGKQVPLDDLPTSKRVMVEEVARTALDKRTNTILGHLMDKLNRHR